ncbi:lasso peptide biosynthesis PqqD family chaperone [Niallia sp. XMNu-256]|uniref:lasso peptide biosynthesis PqqD family chaperone n=1 Tax=Niallia sp. XMNu-256 TaxID=3082444 RepID=UPI0030CA7646
MSKTQNISGDEIFVQNPGNIVSDMDGEKVMLSIENGKYYNLGEIGGAIWDLMKEPISTQELVSQLLSRYEVEPKECEEQVLSFLNELMDAGLISKKREADNS